jgi:nitrate reductase gamma subunit
MDSIKRIHKKGLLNGVLASIGLAALVVIGSRRLQYFDAALVPYLFATLFAVTGIVYRYSVWHDRPSTRRLWGRSLAYFWHRDFLSRLAEIGLVFFRQVALQHFIERRSFYRWVMHFTIAWGTILAFMVTLPLVLGWLHFETVPGQPHLYQLYAFGFPQLNFLPEGLIGFLFFNSLNIAAVLVILGTIMAFTRRILYPGLVAGQTFMNDILPLLILFAVAVTGVFLTFSSRYMGGEHFRTLSTLHCFTVVVFLVYLPFGKFFHIFQRGALLGAAVYIREKKSGESEKCLKCGDAYVSRVQIQDVKSALGELGFKYASKPGTPSIQEFCPACRRRAFMLSQQRQLSGQFDRAHVKKSDKEPTHG